MAFIGKVSFFDSPEKIASFLKKVDQGFCLDINHAVDYAMVNGLDRIQFLKDMLKLNPTHFHLGGQKFSPRKEHLDFSDSDINLEEILQILPKDAEITLEVSKYIDKTSPVLIFLNNSSA